MDGVQHLGTMRHYYAQEDIYFILKSSAAVPFTGGVLSAASINATILFPDGNAKLKHVTPPAGTLTELGGGLYSMALWGDGQSVDVNDVDLAQVGRSVILIAPGSGSPAFTALALTYDVRPDFDVQLAIAYVPGTSGSDMISGGLSFHRWWTHERIASPLNGSTAITGLSLKLTDKDSAANIVSLSGADFSENAFDGNVYFSKAISGVTGARALTARLTGTYKGYTFEKDVMVQVPVAA